MITINSLMKRMLFSVFSQPENANQALAELQKAGFKKNELSVVVQDSVIDEKVRAKDTKLENMAEGSAKGAVAGGTLGALLGLLAGLAVITVPGLGSLLIGGPIAAALGLTGAAATSVSTAVTGALAGGLIGGLVGLGVPEKQAEIYQARIKQGNILLIVRADSAKERENAEAILKTQGAEEINYYSGV